MAEVVTYSTGARDFWFDPRPQELPRGRQGYNSYGSIIGGIITAKLHQPDRNLSEPQLQALERIFAVAAEYFEDIPRVEFRRRLWSYQ